MQRVQQILRRCIDFCPKPWRKTQAKLPSANVNKAHAKSHEEDADIFPTFPPPPPSEILAHQQQYLIKLRRRQYLAPEGIFEDKPLYALYRLYESLVVDHVTGYRNKIEYFWHEHSWLVCEIPDPRDSDPARYAFLAGVTHLLVKAFNNNIKLGLPRDAPAIMSPEQAEEYKARPESSKTYETTPDWAGTVPALAEPLYMRSFDGIVLNGKNDERAEPYFKSKNILFWSPHVLFT